MPCPTCSATMEGLGTNDRGDNLFQCPRCGTVLIDAFGQHGDKVYVPKFVERLREFEKKLVEYSNRHKPGDLLVKTSELLELWHRLGLREAINPPDNRPPQ